MTNAAAIYARIKSAAPKKQEDPHEDLKKQIGETVRGLPAIGAGTGLITSYAPLTRTVTGHMPLWHGTPTENVPKVLEQGLTLEHAGKMKRLNSNLMRNALFEVAADHVPGFMQHDHVKNELFDALDNHQPAPGGHYANELIGKTQDFIKKHTGKEVATEHFHQALSDRGRRIYFGHSPHTITDWSSHKNEAQIAMGNLMDRAKDMSKNPLGHVANQAQFAVDALTGGMVGHVQHGAVPYFQYEKAMAGAQHVEMHPHEMADFIAKNNLHGHQAAMKVHLGKGSMEGIGAFKDFPGLEAASAALSGLSSNLQKVFPIPNYTPGRDISIPNAVKGHHIEELHFFNPDTKKVDFIVKNKAFQAPERMALHEGLRHAAGPLAATYAGAELISLGLTKKTMAQRAFEAAKSKYDEYQQGRKKTAGVLENEARHLGLMASLGGAGLATVAAVPAFMQSNHEDYRAKHPVESVGSEAAITAGAGFGAQGLALGTGAAATHSDAALKSLGLGSGLGMTVGALPLTMASLPHTNIYNAFHANQDERHRARVLTNPGEYAKQVALPGAALLGGLAGHTAYQVHRYYPFHVHAGLQNAKAFLNGPANQLMHVLGANKHLVGAGAIAGGLGLTGLAYAPYAYSTYRNIQENRKKYKKALD